MKPPIPAMSVTPYYDPQWHEIDQWQAFMGLLRFVITQDDLVLRIKKELAIPSDQTFTKKDLPRFADWVAINLWGTTNKL